MRRRSARPTSGTPTLVSCATTVCLGGLVLATLASHLVVNTTPSARLGLYWRSPLPQDRALRHGEYVVLVPPTWVQDELRRVAPQITAARPWMKTIAAVAGETVCLDGDTVTINGTWRAARPLLRHYALTAPQGCTTLPEEMYFVLNDHPRSFDSRYVGAMARAALRGTLTPLYTWEASR